MRGSMPSVNGEPLDVFVKRFDPAPQRVKSPARFFSNLMGKQYNKTEKQRRRKAYLARKKEKAKAASAPAKPKARKSPPKKKEAPAEAAQPAASAE
jgi:hypothetical protein